MTSNQDLARDLGAEMMNNHDLVRDLEAEMILSHESGPGVEMTNNLRHRASGPEVETMNNLLPRENDPGAEILRLVRGLGVEMMTRTITITEMMISLLVRGAEL